MFEQYAVAFSPSSSTVTRSTGTGANTLCVFSLALYVIFQSVGDRRLFNCAVSPLATGCALMTMPLRSNDTSSAVTLSGAPLSPVVMLQLTVCHPSQSLPGRPRT